MSFPGYSRLKRLINYFDIWINNIMLDFWYDAIPYYHHDKLSISSTLKLYPKHDIIMAIWMCILVVIPNHVVTALDNISGLAIQQ